MKIAVEIVGDPDFFATLNAQATRLDHSQSWILQRCLRASLPKLAQLSPGAEIEPLKRSPLRNPIRLASLQANLALADSDDPNLRELATVPKGTEKRRFYLPQEMYEQFDREGDRLKLTGDEILMWAWKGFDLGACLLPDAEG